jgi:hypothetical protein
MPWRGMMLQELLPEQQPDIMLEAEPPAASPASQSPKPQPSVPSSPAARASGVAPAAEGGEEEEEAEDLDPPYVRYLEPTPDDLDLQVEYDLDEEDEAWLEDFNEKVGLAGRDSLRGCRVEQLVSSWVERRAVCAAASRLAALPQPVLPFPPRACSNLRWFSAKEAVAALRAALQSLDGCATFGPPLCTCRRARARAERRGVT